MYKYIILNALILMAASSRAADEIAVKNGETIAFMGDSITQAGWKSNTGYVQLIIAGFKANGIEVNPVPAGISGHKSNQMLARLDKDVLSKKPDWMTLSCGVNDVWHGEKGVNLEDYKRNITKILDQCKAAGVKVMILTATMIKEDPDNDLNAKLAPYNDFLREVARARGLLLADLNAEMQAALKSGLYHGTPGSILTGDGVHMNPLGNELMAVGVLRSFGLNETQMGNAVAAIGSRPVGIPSSMHNLGQMDLARFKKFLQLPPEQQKAIAADAQAAIDAVFVKALGE